jgi:YggT family protein
MRSALVFIFRTFADLYMATFLLRFLLQWVRADYYNPVTQFVLQITGPLVIPARRLLPSVRGWDIPTLVVLLVLECIATFILDFLIGLPVGAGLFTAQVALRLVALVLQLYIIVILLYALLSLLGGRGQGPVAEMLSTLARPVLRPVRQVMPPIGGFDLSPLIVIVLLEAILIALRFP